MYPVEQHLRRLLLDYDCVTVPGLGGDAGRESLAYAVTALLGAGATALAAWAVTRIAKHGRIS